MKIIRFLLLALSIVGAGMSVLSLHGHYATSASEYCDLNETFNCDFVNRSTYSAIHGVPVALVGLLGYFALFACSLRPSRKIAWLRFIAASAGLVFALYLAYVEAYVLAVWCLLCIGSMTCIFGIALFSGIDLFQRRRLPAGAEHAAGSA